MFIVYVLVGFITITVLVVGVSGSMYGVGLLSLAIFAMLDNKIDFAKAIKTTREREDTTSIVSFGLGVTTVVSLILLMCGLLGYAIMYVPA